MFYLPFAVLDIILPFKRQLVPALFVSVVCNQLAHYGGKRIYHSYFKAGFQKSLKALIEGKAWPWLSKSVISPQVEPDPLIGIHSGAQ